MIQINAGSQTAVSAVMKCVIQVCKQVVYMLIGVFVS